jgi:hypothetical protein
MVGTLDAMEVIINMPSLTLLLMVLTLTLLILTPPNKVLAHQREPSINLTKAIKVSLKTAGLLFKPPLKFNQFRLLFKPTKEPSRTTKVVLSLQVVEPHWITLFWPSDGTV